MVLFVLGELHECSWRRRRSYCRFFGTEILSYGWYCEEEPSSIVTFDSTML